MPAAAVVGVANDGMVNVLHVAPQLVFATGFRIQLYQTVAAGGIAFDFHRDFGGRQPAIMRKRFPYRLLGSAQTPVFRLVLQRVINGAGFRRPAPHYRQVGLVHLAGHHGLADRSGGVRVTGKQQNAGGGPVQPMHRIDMLTAVQGPGVLQGKLGFMLVNRAAVYQQAGGFVDCQQPRVPVDFRERVVLVVHYGSRLISARNRSPALSPSTSMAGVSSRVRKVAKARPPAMALDSWVHHWVDGAPNPSEGDKRSTLIPSTMGISPNMVVIAVSNTGRKRRQPVSSAAS